MTQPHRVTSQDGTTIAYDRRGAGPVLVLVAGAFTTRSSFGPLAELLAPHFTVLAYDRRGRGDSGDTLPYAPGREVDDLAAVIDAAGGQALVFGHSSGAALALDAVAAGLNITRLAVYEPPFLVDDSREPDDFTDQLAALVAEDRRDEAVAMWMTKTVRQSDEAIAEWRGSPAWKEMELLVHTAVYDMTIMSSQMTGAPLSPERYAAVTMPVLVLDGEVSPVWQHHSVEALANLLPDVQRHTFAGAGHGAPPEQVAPVLVTFFGGTALGEATP